ncbi:hypothetical protein P1P75_07210 [Streptomyces sp. ID05-39B]|uniref:hypothetical protein n=1 Tax=Streptomyces sp. ID05-39B TaxID=3028664 RepID=UPI0029AC78EE|nr:hypothetical protein [Streptomyces sp. ID05-39B]MDX3526229.1 hypothetical protein [Streptomyces sp. ID05-39B]
MTDSYHPGDDRGCLRLVLAVPITLFTLLGAAFCWTALTIRPSGPWDDDAYRGIELSCLLTIGAAGAVVALWSMPSVRQVVRWWWIGPALVMAGAAVVRWSVIG